MAKWSTDLRRKAALSSSDYLEMMSGSGKFDEIVFFLDCCRIRQIKATGLPSALAFVRPGDLAGKSRRFVGYATEFENSAYEATTFDSVNGGVEPIVRGHFTQALMSALRGGAAIEGGGVPAGNLKEYLEIHTPRIAAEHKHSQIPEIVNGLLTGFAPAFGNYKPIGKVNVNITFKAGRIGLVVLEGPDLRELKRADASTAPWNVHLERGLHALRHLNTGETMPFRVESPEGVSDVNF